MHRVCLILLIIPCITSSSIWDIFGSSEEGEEGECSHWEPSDLFFLSFDEDDLIGFHRTLPIGSFVTVYNDAFKKPKPVTVRIVGNNARIADGRIMTLSPAAFKIVTDGSQVVFDCRVVPTVINKPSRPSPPPMSGGSDSYDPFNPRPDVPGFGTGSMSSSRPMGPPPLEDTMSGFFGMGSSKRPNGGIQFPDLGGFGSSRPEGSSTNSFGFPNSGGTGGGGFDFMDGVGMGGGQSRPRPPGYGTSSSDSYDQSTGYNTGGTYSNSYTSSTGTGSSVHSGTSAIKEGGVNIATGYSEINDYGSGNTGNHGQIFDSKGYGNSDPYARPPTLNHEHKDLAELASTGHRDAYRK